MRATVIVMLMLIVAVQVSAQEETALTNEQAATLSEAAEESDASTEKKPDYSREALLSAMWTDPYFDEDTPRAPETFNPFQFTVFGQTFRFMPFLASPTGSSSSATPFGVVDPFAIAPVSSAYTPKTFRDRWWEWRMKRKLGVD